MTKNIGAFPDWVFDLAVELLLFVFQVLTFFIVAFITSYMFSNEERLTAFVSERINATTMENLGLTLFGVTFCFGLVAIAREVIPGNFIERVSRELIFELPRTIYLFGSSLTAATIAIALFIGKHPSASHTPSKDFLVMSFFFGLVFFLYGYGIKALLLHRSRSRNSAASG